MQETTVDNEIEGIAEEIKHYLEKHPQSVDTVDGVANWWLLRQRYEAAIEKVKKALDYLVRMGIVEKIETMGNQTLYKRIS